MTASPLMVRQQSDGAIFPNADFSNVTDLISGVELNRSTPIHFGNAETEAVAAEESAVVFDLSQRTQLEFTGADRAIFLHNFCTNDIKKLSPGQSCEAFITSVKGRTLGHVFVFAGDDSLWVDTVENQADVLLPHLERYIITDDVELHNRTAEWGTLFLSGPNSTEFLRTMSDGVLSELSLNTHQTVSDFLTIQRVDWFCQPGYLLRIRRTELAVIWSQLVDAGVSPAGAAAFHFRRITAKFPWYGTDFNADNLPQELVRIEKTISFTKGCYLGQEPIARLDAMGHVNRELCDVQISEPVLPNNGDAIFSVHDDDNESKEIGTIRSAVKLAAESLPVALCFLRRGHVQPGGALQVSIDDKLVSAIQ